MIGFIIQGPLITFGQGPNNAPVGYDTHKSILSNIEKINRMGFEYIVITWVPQYVNEELILENLLSQKINIKTVDIPKLEDPDHRYKHHYGIYEGIKNLSEQVDFIVKIRTDQIHQAEFFEYMMNLYISGSNKLCVSELYNDPFFIGDFIYAAEKKVFVNFIRGFLEFKSFNFHPCLAMDIGMKYCHSTGFKEFKKYFPTFYYFVFKADYTRNLWNGFILKHLVVIPANVRDNILWRDKKIGNIVESSYFKFNTEPILKNIKFSTRLVSYTRHWKIFVFKKYPRLARFFKKSKAFIKRIGRK